MYFFSGWSSLLIPPLPPLSGEDSFLAIPSGRLSHRHQLSLGVSCIREAKTVVRDFVLEMRVGRRMMVLSPSGQLKATTCSLNGDLSIFRIVRASQAAWQKRLRARMLRAFWKLEMPRPAPCLSHMSHLHAHPLGAALNLAHTQLQRI